tara:strand:+ start:578 stop:1132 length:555 start_codon:yes stop_codon:yes gene_type:complete
MTLQEEYGLLVTREDSINESLSDKRIERTLTKMSLDMYTIHNKIESRRKRLKILVQYFTNRPGMISKYCPTPFEQAFKMMLYGDFAEITHHIVNISGCNSEDVMIHAEFEKDGFAINTGTLKTMDKELEPIVKKMMKYMVPPTIEKAMAERKEYLDDEDEATIDEETEKALKKMDWDRTVKGEA